MNSLNIKNGNISDSFTVTCLHYWRYFIGNCKNWKTYSKFLTSKMTKKYWISCFLSTQSFQSKIKTQDMALAHNGAFFGKS